MSPPLETSPSHAARGCLHWIQSTGAGTLKRADKEAAAQNTKPWSSYALSPINTARHTAVSISSHLELQSFCSKFPPTNNHIPLSFLRTSFLHDDSWPSRWTTALSSVDKLWHFIAASQLTFMLFPFMPFGIFGGIQMDKRIVVLDVVSCCRIYTVGNKIVEEKWEKKITSLFGLFLHLHFLKV